VSDASDNYRDALALARRDYAAVQARLATLDGEARRLDEEMRRLRGLIYSLATLIGEPHGLEEGKEPQPVRRKRRNASGSKEGQ
jgi:hypothetical protein